MSNEFENLDLDIDQPEPAPRRHNQAVPPQLYALVAILLAVACAYLVWLHGQDRWIIEDLQERAQGSNDQYKKLSVPGKEVKDALTTLADHAANEAELYRSRGSREQVLSNIARARYLLSLAEKLKACSTCPEREMGRIDAKLTKLIDKLQPTQEETARLEPPTDSHTPGPALEKKIPQPQPEQPEVSGENHSGGESDA